MFFRSKYFDNQNKCIFDVMDLFETDLSLYWIYFFHNQEVGLPIRKNCEQTEFRRVKKDLDQIFDEPSGAKTNVLKKV